MKRLLSVILSLVATASAVAQDLSTIKVATYNVDGLPAIEFLGIDINTAGPGDTWSPVIGQRLEASGWDVIGMNEDFNYHSYLTEKMTSYDFQTYGGKLEFSLKAAWKFLSKSWRFSTDGLELATKKGMTVKNETIVPWNNDAVYGYLSNDNDSLTKKGFRYYTVTTTDGYDIDFIILHADAGGADPDKLAREHGFTQLYDFIAGNIKTQNPLIIMGDFNSYYSRDRLKELFLDRINDLPGLTICDAQQVLGTQEQIDKVLYMKRDACSYRLRPTEQAIVRDFLRDDGTTQLSDHYPVRATFAIEENTHDISELSHLIGTLNGSATGHKYDVNGDGKSNQDDVDVLVNKVLKQ